MFYIRTIFFAVLLFVWGVVPTQVSSKPSNFEDEVEVIKAKEAILAQESILIIPEFMSAEISFRHLVSALKYYEVQQPDLVFTMAVIYTNHFKNSLCTKHNNLFGFLQNGEYYTFNHWSESVRAYSKYAKKYKPPEGFEQATKCYTPFI